MSIFGSFLQGGSGRFFTISSEGSARTPCSRTSFIPSPIPFPFILRLSTPHAPWPHRKMMRQRRRVHEDEHSVSDRKRITTPPNGEAPPHRKESVRTAPFIPDDPHDPARECKARAVIGSDEETYRLAAPTASEGTMFSPTTKDFPMRKSNSPRKHSIESSSGGFYFSAQSGEISGQALTTMTADTVPGPAARSTHSGDCRTRRERRRLQARPGPSSPSPA